jgi:hypothetical protein
VPVPFLGYRAYALLRADYYIDRDSLAMLWGLRVEDIPLTDIEWVRPASDVAAQRLANQRRHYQTNDVRDDSCATFLPNGVRPEMLSVMTSENPLQTGDTALAKTFITDHLVSLALALSLAVSVLTAVTTLSITGDLPGHRDGTATREPPTAPDRPVANQLRSVDTNMFELAAMRRATKRAYSAVSAIQSQSQFDESGRIDVNQLLADQRADLAAGERFMEAKFERMGAGFEQSSEFEEQKPE